MMNDAVSFAVVRGHRRRLNDLGLQLPPISPPKGAYVPAVRTGDLVFVSGQVPMTDGEVVVTGKVGAEITPDHAAALAAQCALSALAAVDDIAGLESVVQIVKLVGFIASAAHFNGQATVVNGASELLVLVFGEAGRHARTSVGVAELPLNAPVEIEMIVQVD